MSDEERDIDVESDDDDADQEKTFTCLADKRAHHNALERKRRDHIKDSFCSLRDSIPSLQGEKASRAQILNKATDYIQFMRRKNHTHQADIDELKRQNMILDQQVRQLEKARATGNLSIDASTAAILSSDPTLLAIPPPTEGVLNDNTITAENIGTAGFVSEETNGNDNSQDEYQGSAKRLKIEN